MSFEIDDDITAALQAIGVKAQSAENKAVRKTAPVVAGAIQAATPYENKSDRSWKAQREMDKKSGKKSVFKHMRDGVVYSGIDAFGHINIGWDKDTYWRVHFVELGTVNQRANPFISRGIAAVTDTYQTMIANELRGELKL